MTNPGKNYAFIDSQNVYRGIQSLGWRIDWVRFRVYLREKYGVKIAYLFIGYMPEKASLYELLQKAGFILKFKPVMYGDGKPKGNVDADLVLQAMIDFNRYDKAVIVTSDGDFYCLAEYLNKEKKLCVVLSPHIDHCSMLLKKTAREKMMYMDTLKGKISA